MELGHLTNSFPSQSWPDKTGSKPPPPQEERTQKCHTPPLLPKSQGKCQKCHNPQRTQGESHPEKSLCCSWQKKNPLLQTQGLPEGTGKVINSLRFSQNTFEERQRVTSRVGKTVILKHCKHAGRQSCLPRLPQLYRSQDIASASKLKVVLSWIQLRSHRTVLSWQLRHKPPPALSLWP